jgi:protein-tyrosine-phosphatase
MGMVCFSRQFKKILTITAFLLSTVTAISQVKSKPNSGTKGSARLHDFYQITAEAGVDFSFPSGFREDKALNSDDIPFDYAISMAGHQFEVWFQVRSQKKNWQTYISDKDDPAKSTENPDSAYQEMGQAMARSLKDDHDYLARNLSQEILKQYNASNGKSYLITLPDQSETKHYKYALVLTMERDQTGTLVAVCFTDEQNPEFFKNVSLMSSYIKFKP